MTVTNPYEELALVLDTIPNGYPAVEDGTHLRVLEWIFTPEEAELCRKLKLKAETAETIAIRLERPPDEIETLLETMHSKGDQHVVQNGEYFRCSRYGFRKGRRTLRQPGR